MLLLVLLLLLLPCVFMIWSRRRRESEKIDTLAVDVDLAATNKRFNIISAFSDPEPHTLHVDEHIVAGTGSDEELDDDDKEPARSATDFDSTDYHTSLSSSSLPALEDALDMDSHIPEDDDFNLAVSTLNELGGDEDSDGEGYMDFTMVPLGSLGSLSNPVKKDVANVDAEENQNDELYDELNYDANMFDVDAQLADIEASSSPAPENKTIQIKEDANLVQYDMARSGDGTSTVYATLPPFGESADDDEIPSETIEPTQVYDLAGAQIRNVPAGPTQTYDLAGVQAVYDMASKVEHDGAAEDSTTDIWSVYTKRKVPEITITNSPYRVGGFSGDSSTDSISIEHDGPGRTNAWHDKPHAEGVATPPVNKSRTEGIYDSRGAHRTNVDVDSMQKVNHARRGSVNSIDSAGYGPMTPQKSPRAPHTPGSASTIIGSHFFGFDDDFDEDNVDKRKTIHVVAEGLYDELPTVASLEADVNPKTMPLTISAVARAYSNTVQGARASPQKTLILFLNALNVSVDPFVRDAINDICEAYDSKIDLMICTRFLEHVWDNAKANYKPFLARTGPAKVEVTGFTI
jgi:hypothetical protein